MNIHITKLIDIPAATQDNETDQLVNQVMVHNFSSDIKGKDGPLLPGGVRDDEIISMAVGDVIDDDDDEESMEAWISLHQS